MGNTLVNWADAARLACLSIAGCILLAAPVRAAAPVRVEQPLGAGWSFRLGDALEAAALAGDTAGWSEVAVPHTWNAIDGADGGNDYVRGAGWYVRRFVSDPTWASRRVFIQFDGVNRVAAVFLNGRKLGEHAGGFARFRFEVTGALQAGENILAVRVSNAADGLAPVSGDFTFFGGIYRAVKFVAVDPLHVDLMDFGSDGVYVTPRRVSAERADFTVAATIRNDSAVPERALIRTVVRDGAGLEVAAKEQPVQIPAGGELRGTQDFLLAHPHLWAGRADPHQYTAEVAVMVDGHVRDAVKTRFGLRFFEVDPEKGFRLNGRYLDLHGVNRHQDRAGKGWAVSDADEREDFALIEEMGATAIRVAHYQQSPLWYDLADERGLVVWAEIPVVNEVPDTAAYAANARQQLQELIRQNYNRPAICFWGVGNETREPGESSGKERPNPPAVDRLIADLARLARAEDPMRLSTYASHHRADDVRNFHTDVLGFNKYFGWYGGAPEDFAAWADGVHQRMPNLRFSMSEYGAGANPAQHEWNAPKPVPGGEWHPEEYQNHYHEAYWQAMQARPYIWGKFVWNMFDFAADIRTEGRAPGMNDKGLVSYDRRLRKDAFYWYKANWSSDPVVYLTSRRFTPRPAGKIEVKVYANAAQVELLVNGQSRGVVAGRNRIFRWEIDLAPGENRLSARAVGGPAAADECTILGTER